MLTERYVLSLFCLAARTVSGVRPSLRLRRGARDVARGPRCGSSGPGRWVGITRSFGRAEVADGWEASGDGSTGCGEAYLIRCKVSARQASPHASGVFGAFVRSGWGQSPLAFTSTRTAYRALALGTFQPPLVRPPSDPDLSRPNVRSACVDLCETVGPP
jgi:hypothetical protein